MAPIVAVSAMLLAVIPLVTAQCPDASGQACSVSGQPGELLSRSLLQRRGEMSLSEQSSEEKKKNKKKKSTSDDHPCFHVDQGHTMYSICFSCYQAGQTRNKKDCKKAEGCMGGKYNCWPKKWVGSLPKEWVARRAMNAPPPRQFKRWDHDDSETISKMEFCQGMKALGFKASSKEMKGCDEYLIMCNGNPAIEFLDKERSKCTGLMPGEECDFVCQAGYAASGPAMCGDHGDWIDEGKKGAPLCVQETVTTTITTTADSDWLHWGCDGTSETVSVDLPSGVISHIASLPAGARNVHISVSADKDLDIILQSEGTVPGVEGPNAYSGCLAGSWTHGPHGRYVCANHGDSEGGGDMLCRQVNSMDLCFSGDDWESPIEEKLSIYQTTEKLDLYVTGIDADDPYSLFSGEVVYSYDSIAGCEPPSTE